MVTSIDGRSTRGRETDTHIWTSVEDQKHFVKVIENAKLIIMGSTTYEAARDSLQHKKGRRRVIITRNPSKYENEKISGQLEFTNENAKELIMRLEKEGYKEGFLVGGAHTNTQFFEEKLVTEIWQTLEPKILGIGNGIVGDEQVNVTLELLSVEKLNNKGTLLLKYKIKNP